MSALFGSVARALVCSLLLFTPEVRAQERPAAPAAPPPWKPRLFLISGGLAGTEDDAAFFDGSELRLYTEFGCELGRRNGPQGAWRGWGLAGGLALGGDDLRFSVGPRLTMSVHPDWSIQAGTGPLWTNEEDESGLFDMGWQVRGGLLYHEWASFTALWQVLPWDYHWGNPPASGQLHALYGGILLHGAAGAWASAGVWAGILGAVLLVASSLE
jgi:hypothetical protein